MGAGTLLTARETAVLAAIGLAWVDVVRSPRVAILSTGDEIVEPGTVPLPRGSVYDSNATMLAHAIVENGGRPISLGVVRDHAEELDEAIARAVELADLVVVSGGTSKGAGDLSYRVLSGRSPGIAVHGVALKPGKPVCLGAIGQTPVAILPGFPTSALFTFHEFVAPLIREWSGLAARPTRTIEATLPVRINSEAGRTEYVLVSLVDGPTGPIAYPLGKGSGSVTAFSRADGFVTIDKARESVDAGDRVRVQPTSRDLEPADLIVIGSHCVGLDAVVEGLVVLGFRSKTMWVGSLGGLLAAGRGECDVAGVHLLDAASGLYNVSFLPPGVRLVGGYRRMQGVVFRRGDRRFEGSGVVEILQRVARDRDCRMVGRNSGSGTRVLLDQLLEGARPPGYSVEARSHNAVAASVAQGRADWGLAIARIAELYDLGFLPLRPEQFDFAVPESRWDRPAVAAFRAILERPEMRAKLEALGFTRGESPS